MAKTIVEALLPLFSTPDAKTDHEALCQQVRDYVNSDTTGDIDLTYEIKLGNDEFHNLYNGGDFNPAHTTDMRVLSRIVNAITEVRTEQNAARADLDAEFSSVAQELEMAVSGESAPEPETPADGQDTNAPGDTAEFSNDTEPEPEPAPQEEPVAPATPESDFGNRYKVRPSSNPVRLPVPSSANAFRGANTLAETPRVKYSILAAADVPRVASGSQLSMRELVEATHNRFGIMPVQQAGVGQRRGAIAMIKRTFDRTLTTHLDKRDPEIVDRVASERNLPGGSLIAAARARRNTLTAAGCCTSMTNDVWCSPSETDYTLCPPLATTEGLVDLPTIPVTNGGIRYPVWDLAPTSWHGQIVENSCETPLAPDHFVTDGNEKVCIEGPCPDWQEVRLSLAYLCVRGDILRHATWPALTERFIEDTLIKHQHFMNHRYLSGIWDGSDEIEYDVSGAGIGSVSDSILDRLGVMIAWFRERYHLGMNDTLEGIAPAWFKEYVKLDLARKVNRPFSSVTDAEIDDLFANYATRIQWVYDTEGITEDASMGNGAPVDGRLMPGQWPNNVEMVFYPAGAWVLGQSDIITLDAFYDSTLLAQNKYTALFTEEGFLLLNRCNRSFKLRLTNLCRNGGVAALAPITCPESPAPTPPPEGDGAAALRANASAAGVTANVEASSRRSARSGS